MKLPGRVLEPVERLSEILFGLIMALTITGAVSVVTADRFQIRTMLIAALGCNLAWGIIDAGMYLMGRLGERGRNVVLARAVRAARDREEAHRIIADELPPLLAPTVKQAQLELIRDERQETVRANEETDLPPSTMVDRLMAALPARHAPHFDRWLSGVVHFFTIPTARGVQWAALIAALLVLAQAGVIAAMLMRSGDQSYQVALNLQFDNKQAQDDYQVHLLHIEFVEKCFKVNCARAVVYDFE